MSIGIIIIVLLGILMVDAFIRWIRFQDKRISCYYWEADGAIRQYYYEDCKISIARMLRFYSKGMFQVVVQEKTLTPVWDERINSYFIDVSSADDKIEHTLIVFRERVLVVSNDVKMRVTLSVSKKERFYSWIGKVSVVLFVILVIWYFW